MKRTPVEQVMTTLVVTATEAMPFRDLAALLSARDGQATPALTSTTATLPPRAPSDRASRET